VHVGYSEADMPSRHFNPVSYRLMRCLLHGTLLAGHACGGDTARAVCALLQPANRPAGPGTVSDAALIAQLFQRFKADFAQLQQLLRLNVEDTALALHSFIDSYAQATTAWNPGADVALCKTAQAREECERHFCAQADRFAAADHAAAINALRAVGMQSEEKSLLSEIQERVPGAVPVPAAAAAPSPVVAAAGKVAAVAGADVQQTLINQYRRDNAPALFVRTQTIDLEGFVGWLQSQPRQRDTVPVLNQLVSSVDCLRLCEYLPDVLAWQQLLFQRYSGRKT